MAADQIIDIGPGAGELGGEVVFAGTPKEILNRGHSLTGKYLRGELEIKPPKQRRAADVADAGNSRRERAQPEEHRRGHSARDDRLHHRRLGLGQIDPRSRHHLCGAQETARRVDGARRLVREAGRRPVHRRRGPGRSVSDRPHASLESRHLYQGLRRHPRAVRRRRGRLRPGVSTHPTSASTCRAAGASGAKATGSRSKRCSSSPMSSWSARNARACASSRPCWR